jgi:hypothetical protein
MDDPALERLNRLGEALADLIASRAAQDRAMRHLLERIEGRQGSIDRKLEALDKSVYVLASEQARLGNRIDDFSRGLLALNIRLDGIEDR